jgi:NADH:ubiquinone oxidoreductase subunit 6 (subunit J)
VAVLLGSVLLPLAGDPVDRADVASTQVAGALFGTWVWPFELLSALLLVALVAALAVSRIPREVTDRHPGPGSATGEAAS